MFNCCIIVMLFWFPGLFATKLIIDKLDNVSGFKCSTVSQGHLRCRDK